MASSSPPPDWSPGDSTPDPASAQLPKRNCLGLTPEQERAHWRGLGIVLSILLGIYLLFTFAPLVLFHLYAVGLAAVSVMMAARAWKLFRQGEIFGGVLSVLTAFPPLAAAVIMVSKLHHWR